MEIFSSVEGARGLQVFMIGWFRLLYCDWMVRIFILWLAGLGLYISIGWFRSLYYDWLVQVFILWLHSSLTSYVFLLKAWWVSLDYRVNQVCNISLSIALCRLSLSVSVDLFLSLSLFPFLYHTLKNSITPEFVIPWLGFGPMDTLKFSFGSCDVQLKNP